MTRIRRWLRALLDRLIGPGYVPGQVPGRGVRAACGGARARRGGTGEG